MFQFAPVGLSLDAGHFLVQFQFMDAVLESPRIHRFNSLNAREMAAKSIESRRKRKEAAELAKSLPLLKQGENPLHAQILEQIADIDKDWRTAKPRDRTALAQAKATLYSLLFPKPKPSRSSRQQPAQIEPLTPQ